MINNLIHSIVRLLNTNKTSNMTVRYGLMNRKHPLYLRIQMEILSMLLYGGNKKINARMLVNIYLYHFQISCAWKRFLYLSFWLNWIIFLYRNWKKILVIMTWKLAIKISKELHWQILMDCIYYCTGAIHTILYLLWHKQIHYIK